MDLQSHEKVADRPHDIASGRRSLYTADRTAHACFDSCCLSRSDCWVIIRLCLDTVTVVGEQQCALLPLSLRQKCWLSDGRTVVA